MRFIIDADLPAFMARRLRELGHACNHMSELGRGTEPDAAVYALAQNERRIIISKDRRFADITEFPLEEHFGVIRIRARDLRREELTLLVEDFLGRHPESLDHTLVVLTPNSERFRRAE